jgi:iron(III) transport system substrate-binding protein
MSLSKIRTTALATAALVALAATAVLAGSAGARTPNPIAELVAKSKKESGLVFYGNPPTANFEALVAKFKAKYPWIKVTSYDLEDNTIFSKYASEAAQGVRTADILIASAPNLWVYAHRQGFAATYTPPSLASNPKAYPSWVKQFDGIYIMSPDPVIIVYNKLLLGSTVPRSVKAIADDPGKYAKVTGYTVENTFGYTALYGYVQKLGWSNLQKIGRRLSPTTGVSSQLQLVAQGGAVAAFLTSPTARFRIATDAGLKDILGWSYVYDAQPLVPRGIGITKKARSPASARLFLNWVYSAAGQQAMCDAGFTAFKTGFKPSNGCANTLATLYKRVGVQKTYLPGFTPTFVNARPAFAKRWHSIFG